MSASDESVDKATVRKKNVTVLVALALGIIVPALHIMFFAPLLPTWLNVVIVGGVFWICFFEIIPSNTIGIFRRKK
jgi:hypothetical protein